MSRHFERRLNHKTLSHNSYQNSDQAAPGTTFTAKNIRFRYMENHHTQAIAPCEKGLRCARGNAWARAVGADNF